MGLLKELIVTGPTRFLGNVYFNYPIKFTNDMTTFADADDVFTLMVHLGYLSYDSDKKTVRIPNKEVRMEFYNAIQGAEWTDVIDAIQSSKELLVSCGD